MKGIVWNANYEKFQVKVDIEFSRTRWVPEPEEEKRFKKNLHIFGDSHAHSFTGSPFGKYGLGEVSKPHWNSISLGTVSSLSLLNEKWKIFEKFVQKLNLEEGSYILFPMGEKECRFSAMENCVPDPNDVLTQDKCKNLLKPYLDSIQEIYAKTENMGFRVIGWGGHLSKWQGSFQDPDMAALGTEEQRLQLGLYWNFYMETFCSEKGIPFVAMTPLMLSKDLDTRDQFLFDLVHLKTDILEGVMYKSLFDLGINLNHPKEKINIHEH
jgi:hypothetical protein